MVLRDLAPHGLSVLFIVNRIWPLQAWAFNANTPHRLMCVWGTNSLTQVTMLKEWTPERPCNLPHSLICSLNELSTSAREVNPDADIVPFDATQLVMDTSGDTVRCYDAAGHLAGRVTLPRLYHLERR